MKNDPILNTDEPTQININIDWLIQAADKSLAAEGYEKAITQYEIVLTHQDFTKLDNKIKFKFYSFYGLACIWYAKQHAENYYTYCFKGKDQFIKALENYSPEYATLLDDSVSPIKILQIYLTLSSLYFDEHQYEQALKFLKNVIPHAQSLQEKIHNDESYAIMMQLLEFEEKSASKMARPKKKAQRASEKTESQLPKKIKPNSDVDVSSLSEQIEKQINDNIHTGIKKFNESYQGSLTNLNAYKNKPLLIKAYEETVNALTVTYNYLASNHLHHCSSKNVSLNKENFSIKISGLTILTFINNFKAYAPVNAIPIYKRGKKKHSFQPTEPMSMSHAKIIKTLQEKNLSSNFQVSTTNLAKGFSSAELESVKSLMALDPLATPDLEKISNDLPIKKF